MKKKIMLGILTIVSCFSLGSTSFAATVPTDQNASSAISAVTTGLPGSYEERIIHMKSGESRVLFGDYFYLAQNDGAINFWDDGFITAVQYGVAYIDAYDTRSNHIVYIILVDR